MWLIIINYWSGGDEDVFLLDYPTDSTDTVTWLQTSSRSWKGQRLMPVQSCFPMTGCSSLGHTNSSTVSRELSFEIRVVEHLRFWKVKMSVTEPLGKKDLLSWPLAYDSNSHNSCRILWYLELVSSTFHVFLQQKLTLKNIKHFCQQQQH